MKIKFLRAEILLIGILLCGVALFAIQLGLAERSSWGFSRVSLFACGFFLLVVSGIFNNIIIGHERILSICVYVNQILIWCIVVFLCLEIILRITVYNPPLYTENTNYLGTIPAENSQVFWTKEGFAWTRYGKYGEISTPFQGGTIHILILGDSHTEGWQVSDEFKYASVAEKILHAKNNSIDLHNFGRSGLGIADYVTFIPLLKSIYPAKLIVVQVTPADFVESFQPDKLNYFIKKGGELDLVHNRDLSAGRITSSSKILNLSSMVRDEINVRIKAMQNNTSVSTEGFNPELAQQQLDKLLKACDGLPLMLLLLPNTPNISGDQINYDDPEYESLKMVLSNNSSFSVVDTLPEFQKLAKEGFLPRGFFNSNIPGTGHLNVQGNEIVGKLLAEAIDKVLK